MTKPKSASRLKQRAKREAQLGPQRAVLDWSELEAVLECGHVISNPPFNRENKVPKLMPAAHRCIRCKDPS